MSAPTALDPLNRFAFQPAIPPPGPGVVSSRDMIDSFSLQHSSLSPFPAPGGQNSILSANFQTQEDPSWLEKIDHNAIDVALALSLSFIVLGAIWFIHGSYNISTYRPVAEEIEALMVSADNLSHASRYDEAREAYEEAIQMAERELQHLGEWKPSFSPFRIFENISGINFGLHRITTFYVLMAKLRWMYAEVMFGISNAQYERFNDAMKELHRLAVVSDNAAVKSKFYELLRDQTSHFEICCRQVPPMDEEDKKAAKRAGRMALRMLGHSVTQIDEDDDNDDDDEWDGQFLEASNYEVASCVVPIDPFYLSISPEEKRTWNPHAVRISLLEKAAAAYLKVENMDDYRRVLGRLAEIRGATEDILL